MSSSEDGNIKNLKCEFCPIVFSNIDDLANHLVNGHANKTINNIGANDSTKKILIEMNIKITATISRYFTTLKNYLRFSKQKILFFECKYEHQR